MIKWALEVMNVVNGEPSSSFETFIDAGEFQARLEFL